MYLESFTLNNYRKFRDSHNKIIFVPPKNNESFDSDDGSNHGSVVAESATLLVGQNNAGKTTVINGLNFIRDGSRPKITDFNYQYLKELISRYREAYLGTSNTSKSMFNGLPTPSMQFELVVVLDSKYQDSLGVFGDLAKISITGDEGETPVDLEVSNRRVPIHVSVGVTEDMRFRNRIFEKFEANPELTFSNNSFNLEDYMDIFNAPEGASNFKQVIFKHTVRNAEKEPVTNFTFKKLIDLKYIKADRDLDSGELSAVFNKIIKYQLDKDDSAKTGLLNSLHNINERIDDSVADKNRNVSDVLDTVAGRENINVELKGKVTYDELLGGKGLIKYNFLDEGDVIPESQFGLGYISLLNIVGEVMGYVDAFEEGAYHNRISLLFIEEPEAHMHPQMQEFFIERIESAVETALSQSSNDPNRGFKELFCQIVITTHSPHIVNSKIHCSGSFNSINYLNTHNRNTRVINLDDESLAREQDRKSKKKNDELESEDPLMLKPDELTFIKKHIKFKVSELFFADAVVFVEGMSEETLLKFYIDKEDKLRNKYITVFNINGAHGKVYLPLAKILELPCLMVTDLDIKRTEREKSEFVQITDLTDRETTNATIQALNVIRGVKESERQKLQKADYYKQDNILVVFQRDSIKDYYATSLEEAFVLSNHDNSLLNKALEGAIRPTYNELVKEDEKGNKDYSQLIAQSYKVQSRLSGSKSVFASQLLYECLVCKKGTVIPALPNYLDHGFNWLKQQLSDYSVNTAGNSEDVAGGESHDNA